MGKFPGAYVKTWQAATDGTARHRAGLKRCRRTPDNPGRAHIPGEPIFGVSKMAIFGGLHVTFR